MPASKSISNRALLLAALSKTPLSALTNISDCDDTRAMLTALGSEAEIVDVGAAGTAMRFLTAYFCLSAKPHVLTGSPRMLERPIGVLVEALRSMGADISYEGAEGFPPLRIAPSHLHGGRLELRGDVSSQYVSALLMIAPMLADGLTLHLTGDIASKPYIEMTMAMMRSFGAEVNWQDERTICVAPKCYHKADYMIESDWSAASYWYSIVALSDNEHETATLKGLFDESLQGDSGLRALFSQMGVQSIDERILARNGRNETPEDISRALDAGATGALMKTVTNKQLADAIRHVAAGEKVVAQEITKSMIANPPVADLTARQLEILHSVSRGLTNEDIATQLGISANAVKHHLSTIFAKIGAANRAEATNIAMQRHLLKPQMQ